LNNSGKCEDLNKEVAHCQKALKLGEEKERALAREIYIWEKKSNKYQNELNDKLLALEEASVKVAGYDQVLKIKN
jgi:phage-related minor tail protein